MASLLACGEDSDNLSQKVFQSYDVSHVIPGICERPESVTSYDVNIHMRETDPFGSGRWITSDKTLMVDGNDFYGIWFLDELHKDPLVEWIRKDGLGYIRTVDDEHWELLENEPSSEPPVPTLGENPVCPDMSGYQLVDEEVKDGIKVLHYANFKDRNLPNKTAEAVFADMSSGGNKEVEGQENWIAEGGQLLLFKSVTHKLKTENDERRTSTTHRTFTIFNIDEPNTITVPETKQES